MPGQRVMTALKGRVSLQGPHCQVHSQLDSGQLLSVCQVGEAPGESLSRGGSVHRRGDRHGEVTVVKAKRKFPLNSSHCQHHWVKPFRIPISHLYQES